ncbi:unnamed protein product [Durusdinium trenchii]|uniref:Uncharacterized protein n=1 Tax=Durusdinium trenchii TaxID=1381693 RepID=A0ABP0I106_9DINO
MWLFPYDIKTTIFSDSFGSWRPRAAGDATEPLELEIWPERQGEVPRGPSAVETALEGRHFQVKAWGEQMYGTLVDLPCFVESHILPPQNASQALYKSANVEQMLIVHREEELPDTDRLERKTFRWRSGLTPATANVVERWKGVPPSNSIFAPPLIREATKALKSRLDRSDFTYEEEAEVDEAFCAKIRQEEPQNVWVPPEGLRAPMRDPPAASAPSSGHGTGTAASQPPSQLEGSASEVSLQSGVKASGALSTGATPKPGLRLKLGGRDKMDRTHVFPCDRHRLRVGDATTFRRGAMREWDPFVPAFKKPFVQALRTRIQVLSRETSATQAGKPVPSIASGCFVGPINPMGCALSSPVELIRVQRQGSSAFRCAVAEMQGWRVGHEDAHAMRCEGSSATCLVFDGHGGDGAALFAAPELCEDLYKGEKAPDVPSDAHIEGSFAHVDQKLRGYFQEHAEKDSGTTVVGAVCARTKDNSYTVKLLNCGDSRAVIVRNPKDEESNSVSIRRPSHIEALACLGAGGTGNPAKGIDGRPIEDDSSPSGKSLVVVETIDHKPDHPTEKQRIETAGGTVSFEDPPRLDGSLAVSRGLGDFEYKADGKRTVGEQKVSCIPDIYEVSSLAPGTLCILGCDGIWDVMTAEQVAQLVCEALATDLDLGDIAAEILRQCLQRNSRDNMTCMIMHFADGSDWANFPDEMKNYDKLANGDHDEDVQSHYASFLSTAKFPAQAVACDVCQRWLVQMQQCTCKQTFYCSRHCQKKGWKVHSAVCPTKLDGAKRESAAA